jgi:hypothetical protein
MAQLTRYRFPGNPQPLYQPLPLKPRQCGIYAANIHASLYRQVMDDEMSVTIL